MRFELTGCSPPFKQVIQSTQSADERIRSAAMQHLLSWAKQDVRVHAEALPIFRAAAAVAPDALTATTAASGIEFIAGAQAAWPAWHLLLNHPLEQMAVSAAFALTDASFVPVLLELLAKRSETRVQCAVLRALGRLKDPSSFPALVHHLANSDTRPAAIQALEDFDDARAIPQLEPFLKDETQTATIDDRGWPLSVSELANYAISHLRARAGRRSPSPGGPDGQ